MGAVLPDTQPGLSPTPPQYCPQSGRGLGRQTHGQVTIRGELVSSNLLVRAHPLQASLTREFTLSKLVGTEQRDTRIKSALILP